MIGKRMILLGIEDFQQRTGRITAEIIAEFVDFIEQEQRVFYSGLNHALNDFAWHRTDIGTAVAADFAFILYAAQSHADILPARRFGN